MYVLTWKENNERKWIKGKTEEQLEKYIKDNNINEPDIGCDSFELTKLRNKIEYLEDKLRSVKRLANEIENL